MGKGIIGIDGSKLNNSQKTGVEKTVFYIAKNLVKKNSEKYLFYTPFSIHKISEFKNANERIVPGKRYWHRFRLPLALYKDKPDKFLSISNSLPPLAPDKSVQILHDFAFRFFPRAYSKKELFLQEETVKNSIKKAKCIILTSDANRQDFIKFYDESKVKTAVVPLAFDDNLFQPIKSSRDVLNLDEEYILFVGRLETKKNIPNIVKAFNQFKQNSGSKIKLVLAGKPGYGFSEIETLISDLQHKKDIVMPGYIKENDLPHLYAKAKVFFFPSLYEGFGIPVLEAMAVGTPVITSNIPTIREIAGEAAIFIEPQDIDQMAKELDNLINDEKLREDLIAKGISQSKKFSWEKTADQIDNLLTNL